MPATFRVGLLGHGTVGSAFARLLAERAGEIEALTGLRPELSGVLTRSRGDFDDIVGRSQLVVELMGGLDPARGYVLAAMAAGRHVVTANKQLLSRHGEELWAAAREHGVQLRFEAAVAGVVPVVRVLQESLAGAHVDRIHGIVNGTTNFILSRMAETGATYAEALAEAQRLGYAEADPTSDIDGFDAAAKAAILAGLAFHTRVTAADVHREGIAGVTAADVASARAMGCTVKLLAICDRDLADGSVGIRVHPAMIPRTHPLAGVGDAFNAVYVEADAAGQLMFYGRGAGGAPTASAVLGDVVAVARNRLSGGRGAGESAYADLRVRSVGESATRYHISLDVLDRPGVLAAVAQAFAAHEVSISTVRQAGRGDDATLVLVTHTAPDAALAATVDDLRSLAAVR
ncbi:MAG TPA: homoserine dehydrogenase, partial [Solirubrobacteraceae bacterium]|nr:homoserine dehydrogenase [Solirubrobacteraceae bacterium]